MIRGSLSASRRVSFRDGGATFSPARRVVGRSTCMSSGSRCLNAGDTQGSQPVADDAVATRIGGVEGQLPLLAPIALTAAPIGAAVRIPLVPRAGRRTMIQLTVNGVDYDLDVTPDMPLLWALRDVLGLTGTKYGCGVALCGACTVLDGDEPIRTCTTPISAVEGASIVTIEGLSPDGLDSDDLDPVQRAWLEEDVPQCGYCQGGQILTAAALLRRYPEPTDAQIERAMTGILCRCGTYHRVRRAILRAAGRPADPHADDSREMRR